MAAIRLDRIGLEGLAILCGIYLNKIKTIRLGVATTINNANETNKRYTSRNVKEIKVIIVSDSDSSSKSKDSHSNTRSKKK